MDVVYIPPNSTEDILLAHCSAVESITNNRPGMPLFLFSDSNLPLATRAYSERDGLLVGCPQNHPAKVLCDSFSYLDLMQSNSIPNQHGVYLDFIFNSISDYQNLAIQQAVNTLLPNNYYHVSVICDIFHNKSVHQLGYTTTYFQILIL